MAQLNYRIEVFRPEIHRFRVELLISDPDPEGQCLKLAAWTPGSYMIRDFARNVVRIEALQDNEPLELQKLDKQSWLLPAVSGPVLVRYELHARDRSVRASHLDLTHAFFDGACMFLRVVGKEQSAATVELLRPQNPACSQWQVATSMARTENVDPQGFGVYSAGSYEDLIDHPVEMAEQEQVRYQVGGVPHAMALNGRYRMDATRLTADLEKICATQFELFGELPFASYLFLTTVTGDAYGGLEHRSSSALICRRNSLPSPNATGLTDEYREFLGLCSHEYFHAWNIKRIRPASFIPYSLDSESYTRLLWVFEGFTSYYDDLALVRSGVIEPESYLELLGQTMTRVLRGSGREKQSVAESSFDAWSKFYKQDASSPNLIVSYYAKGALIALALDLRIRQETGHEKSLDDVMRLLWRDYGAQDRGVPEDAMPAIIFQATGVDCSSQVRDWAEGCEDPSLETLLDAHGIALCTRPEASLKDRGGKSAEPQIRQVAGLRCENENGFARVAMVFEDSPAAIAGLAPGDLLVAIDGVRATPDGLDSLFDRCAGGDRLAVDYFREDVLLKGELVLHAGPDTTAWLEIRDRDRLLRWIRPAAAV